MTKKHYYSLDEISTLLNIPKSTLRYWEKEKLIAAYRNEENRYREYSTAQLIDICEIKFYRDLNFSITDIKKLYSDDFEANHVLIEEAKNELTQKIKDLEKTILEIEKYQYRHKLVRTLKQRHLTKEQPDFKTLYYFHPGKTPNLINYLKNPSILSFVLTAESHSLQHFTTFEKASAVEPLTIVWEYDDTKEYFCFLLTSEGNNLDETTLAARLAEVVALDYTPINIIGRYLVTQNVVDYYQVWIEATV